MIEHTVYTKRRKKKEKWLVCVWHKGNKEDTRN